MSSLSELREMSNDQMSAVLREACKDLFNLRIKAQTDRLDAPSEMKRNRKLIAQIKTIFRQREIAPRTKLPRTVMPKRVLTGRVKSDKMNKTRVVQIARLVRHPKYGKIYRDRTTCYVHDANNESK